MFRRILMIAILSATSAAFVGCAEKDVKTSSERQEQTESGPRDVSPGEMVVE